MYVMTEITKVTEVDEVGKVVRGPTFDTCAEPWGWGGRGRT